MKTIYFECNMGAAGDMLMGALLELYGDREGFIEMMNNVGIDGVKISAEDNIKCGIAGTKIHVQVHDHEEHEHHHGHEDAHQSHHHSSYLDIVNKISHFNLPDKVKKDAENIYRIIGDAESAVHGTDIEHIHFHEVGTLDAVADVTGCCLLMYLIGADKVITSPVNTGSGLVHCAHGILPVPAPATSLILKGIPIYSSGIQTELCTPTGAAILKYFSDSFGEMPVMCCEKVGYGMGTKELKIANCVRAFLGETEDRQDKILSIQCNIDDMTGEMLGNAVEVLMENGAADVFTIPIYMKKNRPAVLLECLCKPEEKDKFTRLIFSETTTRGMRFNLMQRCIMDYEISEIETEYGKIRIKKNTGFGITKAKPEYDDIKSAAKRHNIPFEKVYKSVMSKIQ